MYGLESFFVNEVTLKEIDRIYSASLKRALYLHNSTVVDEMLLLHRIMDT